MITQLTPYLHFDGTCEAAFCFYREVLGGDFNIIHRYDHPAINMNGIDRNKVLHAEFHVAPTLIFYGCDYYPNRRIIKGNAEPALSLTFDEQARARAVFDKLKSEGMVLLPFGMQFWNAMHGQVIDRFGIKWMINQ